MSANWLNLLKAGESCATGARYWIAKIQIKSDYVALNDLPAGAGWSTPIYSRD